VLEREIERPIAAAADRGPARRRPATARKRARSDERPRGEA
jgi:hypothetical protein